MVPRLTPNSGGEKEVPSGFSLELYLKHREYNALLGVLAMTVALIVRMNFIT
jgi:hypothetical protein